MVITRRQLLLAGLGAGSLATGIHKHWQLEAERKRQALLQQLALAQALTPTQARSKLKEWFGGDDDRAKQGLAPFNEQATLAQPKLLYSRPLSKILIYCCALGTHQYVLGKYDGTYDGTIDSLPTYSKRLADYTQVASLRAAEDDFIQEDVEIALHNTQKPGLLEGKLNDVGNTIGKVITQKVKLTRQTHVYFGYALTSKTHNIIAFRGTNRNAEWLNNILLLQSAYEEKGYGKIHAGFSETYSALVKQVREVAKELNPALPCYITGHSLGGALATLAAIDLAIQVPQLKDRLQLYTYASPRVGDPEFATKHSHLIPNSYRVVNLADTVAITPPVTVPIENMRYAHIGQLWSFLANLGDASPNHLIVTYRAAIERELETNKPRNYPVAGT